MSIALQSLLLAERAQRVSGLSHGLCRKQRHKLRALNPSGTAPPPC